MERPDHGENWLLTQPVNFANGDDYEPAVVQESIPNNGPSALAFAQPDQTFALPSSGLDNPSTQIGDFVPPAALAGHESTHNNNSTRHRMSVLDEISIPDLRDGGILELISDIWLSLGPNSSDIYPATQQTASDFSLPCEYTSALGMYGTQQVSNSWIPREHTSSRGMYATQPLPSQAFGAQDTNGYGYGSGYTTNRSDYGYGCNPTTIQNAAAIGNGCTPNGNLTGTGYYYIHDTNTTGTASVQQPNAQVVSGMGYDPWNNSSSNGDAFLGQPAALIPPADNTLTGTGYDYIRAGNDTGTPSFHQQPNTAVLSRPVYTSEETGNITTRHTGTSSDQHATPSLLGGYGYNSTNTAVPGLGYARDHNTSTTSTSNTFFRQPTPHIPPSYPYNSTNNASAAGPGYGNIHVASNPATTPAGYGYSYDYNTNNATRAGNYHVRAGNLDTNPRVLLPGHVNNAASNNPATTPAARYGHGYPPPINHNLETGFDYLGAVDNTATGNNNALGLTGYGNTAVLPGNENPAANNPALWYGNNIADTDSRHFSFQSSAPATTVELGFGGYGHFPGSNISTSNPGGNTFFFESPTREALPEPGYGISHGNNGWHISNNGGDASDDEMTEIPDEAEDETPENDASEDETIPEEDDPKDEDYVMTEDHDSEDDEYF